MCSNQEPISIIRLKQVLRKTGIGRSTLYHQIKSGEFPRPIKLGSRSVGWITSEIESWITAKAQKNRGEPA